MTNSISILQVGLRGLYEQIIINQNTTDNYRKVSKDIYLAVVVVAVDTAVVADIAVVVTAVVVAAAVETVDAVSAVEAVVAVSAVVESVVVDVVVERLSPATPRSV